MKRQIRHIPIAILLLAILFPQSPSFASGDLVLWVSKDIGTQYSRSYFKHWIDEDKDGCNTRNEVLIAEAKSKPRIGARCALSGGRWVSAYDGKIFTSASGLDIDHLVPLAEAWRSGAANWTALKRQQFANDIQDPVSLIAVSASSNRQKGDKDPSEWLPAKNVCNYVADWIHVKNRYSLTVDFNEHKALEKYITTCNLPAVSFHTSSTGVQPLPSSTPSSTISSSPTVTPSSTTPSSTVAPSTTLPVISPGAFCSPAGAQGVSSTGVIYTCKTSDTDTRNRWRR